MHADLTNDKKYLKILFMTSDKYPLFRPAARAIFSEELIGRGHKIDFILQAAKSCYNAYTIPLDEGLVYIGPTDDGESRLRRLKKHLLDIKNDLRMFRLLRKTHYDLIQVKDKYISALLAIIAAKLGKAKFFYWIAFPHPEASIYRAKECVARYRFYYFLRGLFFEQLLYHVILPLSDHIFVQSDQMKKDIAGKGISEEKMTPIPGSLNLKNIPFKTNSNENLALVTSDEKRIVYLGTLNRMRKLDFLIRALEKVLVQLPNSKLYLIGKGDMPEDEETLKAEVARLGIRDAVEFMGYLPMKIAWEYIRYADVCVSPYYPTPILNSTSPTKLIEYMAMGKPVVLNNHPEQRLIASESGAGICVDWHEGAFAEAIVAILMNPKMANEMGIKGRQYVEKFRTSRVMADIVENQYLSVCQNR
ncbi:hypothetical protein C6A37_01595 [Desulfobacteraceae bacterium SEEP-SAG9]|nr:hypothetical protein C6A37_01595 [Desulfobacteraceae bacterium SEEP-SAG9]